jgi:hypothetical protein
MPRKLKPLYKQPDEVKKQYEGSIVILPGFVIEPLYKQPEMR